MLYVLFISLVMFNLCCKFIFTRKQFIKYAKPSSSFMRSTFNLSG
uniref:Uncharacterized protein n=1 Tax=Medicago truncatula TaxID=3880 RepID=I3S848_MEDTR|nr:unknown [Medicago truncatula]